MSISKNLGALSPISRSWAKSRPVNIAAEDLPPPAGSCCSQKYSPSLVMVTRMLAVSRCSFGQGDFHLSSEGLWILSKKWLEGLGLPAFSLPCPFPGELGSLLCTCARTQGEMVTSRYDSSLCRQSSFPPAPSYPNTHTHYAVRHSQEYVHLDTLRHTCSHIFMHIHTYLPFPHAHTYSCTLTHAHAHPPLHTFRGTHMHSHTFTHIFPRTYTECMNILGCSNIYKNLRVRDLF